MTEFRAVCNFCNLRDFFAHSLEHIGTLSFNLSRRTLRAAAPRAAGLSRAVRITAVILAQRAGKLNKILPEKTRRARKKFPRRAEGGKNPFADAKNRGPQLPVFLLLVLCYNIRRKAATRAAWPDAAKIPTGAAPFSRACCRFFFARCFARGLSPVWGAFPPQALPRGGVVSSCARSRAGHPGCVFRNQLGRGRKRSRSPAREGRRQEAEGAT